MICTPWITETDLSDCKLCDIGELAPGQAAMIIETASQILYLLSGQQFPGQCEDTVRPCHCHCNEFPLSWQGPTPVRYSTGWRNVCGQCGGYCGSSGIAVLLPKRPVVGISSVTIDGSVFVDYRLDSPGWLVRTDGGTWPTCQDPALEPTEAGTWQVSYLWGKVPPAALRYAATVFSSELVKACTGDGSCRIPAGAVTVNRQGVTYDFDLEDGKVGLYEVDQVLDAFNPGRRKRKARIYSPDDPQWLRTSTGS